jgi:3-deoxy-D-manno-octulosonic-acid transferase
VPAFPDSARLEAAAAGRPVVVAASTGEGEEEIVIQAWHAVTPRPLLVIAPRRPERFDDVARLVESRGLRLLRRSSSIHHSPFAALNSPDVYLLDSIGELASVYRGARLAFIGGSLVASGGHNPIEAWAEGVSVVTGPHMENFREITAAGSAGGFLRRVHDARELAAEIQGAIASPAAAEARGDDARRFVAEARGAAQATARLVLAIAAAADREKMAAP